MTGWHQVWHVSVLTVTLFGVAALAIVLLSPVVFDRPPEGLVRARPYLVGFASLAGVLLAAEWLGVH